MNWHYSLESSLLDSIYPRQAKRSCCRNIFISFFEAEDMYILQVIVLRFCNGSVDTSQSRSISLTASWKDLLDFICLSVSSFPRPAKALNLSDCGGMPAIKSIRDTTSKCATNFYNIKEPFCAIFSTPLVQEVRDFVAEPQAQYQNISILSFVLPHAVANTRSLPNEVARCLNLSTLVFSWERGIEKSGYNVIEWHFARCLLRLAK